MGPVNLLLIAKSSFPPGDGEWRSGHREKDPWRQNGFSDRRRTDLERWSASVWKVKDDPRGRLGCPRHDDAGSIGRLKVYEWSDGLSGGDDRRLTLELPEATIENSTQWHDRRAGPDSRSPPAGARR